MIYDVSVPMALVDFIPVLLSGLVAVCGGLSALSLHRAGLRNMQ